MKKTILALTFLIIMAATGYGQADCDCDLKPWTPKVCYDKCWKALVGSGKAGLSSLTKGELLLLLGLPSDVANKIAEINRRSSADAVELYEKELEPEKYKLFVNAVQGLSAEQTNYIAIPLKDRQKILLKGDMRSLDKIMLQQSSPRLNKPQ